MFLKNISKAIKNPKHLQKNICLIYSPEVVNNKLATHIRFNTINFSFTRKFKRNHSINLPKKSKGLITSIFRGDEINEFNSDQQHLWIEKLSKSFEETVKTKKNQPLEFLVIEPENFKFKYETTSKR